MDRISVTTPLGPATAFTNKGVLTHVILAKRQVGGYAYDLSMLGLFNIEPASDPQAIARVIALASKRFAPFVDRLAGYHAEALAGLAGLGWPQDLPLDMPRFQLETLGDRFTEQQRAERAAQLSFYADPHHLVFYISADGTLTPKLPPDFATHVVPQVRAAHDRAKAAPLKHKVFGSFRLDTLTPLKGKKQGGKVVGFDLYLAEADLGRFSPSDLDPFVPLRDALDTLLPALPPRLGALRHDWADTWLDPLNADAARAFHKAFPDAAGAGTVSAQAFQDALWLSRICVQPFGGGGAPPHATWDFHALPKGRDDTIFVIRTKPDGTVIEVTTES